MTLYELLHKVSFDELIPTLEGVYDVKDIYSYREAFDELMLNEAAGQTDGVIELSRDEDDTPSFMERPDNKYRRKWSEVHSRQQMMYARGRKEKRECFRGAMSLRRRRSFSTSPSLLQETDSSLALSPAAGT